MGTPVCTAKRPRRRVYRILGPLLGLLLASCVEPYSGSRIQANLSLEGDLGHEFLVLPTPGRRHGDQGYFSHYELHAAIGGHGLVRLASFIIQPVIRVDHPCLQFLPDTLCVPSEEYPCDPYVNMKRYRLLELVYGVVSPGVTRPTGDASAMHSHDHVPGYDFTTWPDPLFYDPYETASASKLARGNLYQDRVEEFCAHCLPEGYYVGNPYLLTQPRGGALHGVVDGPDPRTGAAVGGFVLMVPGQLDKATALFLYREPDPSRLSRENRWRTDLPPGPGSQLLLAGHADGTLGSIRDGEVRGVRTVRMRSPYALPLYLDMTIFTGIDTDPIGL